MLFDLDYYDFWLVDRIDANDGWFGSRLKTNATPEVVEELRPWRGNAILLEGKPRQDVLDDLQRDVIDVQAKVSFLRRPYRGSRSTAKRCIRLVGLWNAEEERYHLYLTNLGGDAFEPSEIGLLYRARWEVERTFCALKSRFQLNMLR